MHDQNKWKILFFTFLLVLKTFSLQAKFQEETYESLKNSANQTDYVIVGLGTSGPVMARLLTDDGLTSVTVLHNGEYLTNDPLIAKSKNAFITVPYALIGEPLYQNGLTTPQVDANGQQLVWAVASPAGGASSINAGAYCRGTTQLYAQWELIAGPEWSVKRILSLFKKLENYSGKTENPRFRGFHGPLDIFQAPKTTFSKKISKAVSKATGFPILVDYNDPKTPIGAAPQFQETQRGPNGKFRVSSINAFLDENAMTPEGKGVNGRKLRVHFDAMALRIIWEGNKAVGVEYLQNGKTKNIYAKKGVILCAGLMSSFVLLHSGVGPRQQLEALNIPVVVDNPHVGEGLIDQTGIFLQWKVAFDDFPTKSITLFKQISWFPSPAPGSDQNQRQLRLAFTYPFPGFSLAAFDLLLPQSKGRLTINSANPLDPPIVDLGDFSNSADLNLFQQGMQVYIKKINQVLHEMDPNYVLINPDPAILDDSAAVIQYIKANITSNQSFQCTCKMAPQNQNGVVDSRGRVYGCKNLIVADISISPTSMDGSTMSNAYMIPLNIARMLLRKDQATLAKMRAASWNVVLD